MNIPIYYTSVQGKLNNKTRILGTDMNTASPTTPREIKRNGTAGLTIKWSDNLISELTSEALRRNCPCAECREKRGDDTHAKPLTGKKRSLMIVESSLEQELQLEQIWAIGQYAIGIRWGDGHDSGIYSFEFLRQLALGENRATQD